MSKVIRIQEDALEIALNYGNTLSEGIRAMERILKQQNHNLDIEDIRLMLREELENIGRY